MANFKCNICNCLAAEDFRGRKLVLCTGCGSLERTRILWAVLDKKIRPGVKVLHFAPEKGIFEQLSKRLNKNDYVVADVEAHRYTFTNQITPSGYDRT